jgi:DNA-binding NtrC family response regulator
MSSRPRPLVLVVDDCECLRVVLKLVMRELAGIHAVVVATSEEALKLARWRRFDVVISDIVRPGMDGLEFLRTFKQLRPTVPVNIASGVLDDATARWAKWLRAFDCLRKPFAFWELMELVRAAIQSKRGCRTVVLSSRSRHSRSRSW